MSKYVDNENIKPLFSIPVQVKDRQWDISIFANDNQIYMVRLTIPSLQDDKLEDAHCEVIQSLKEHVLSVLRLAYEPDVDFFRRSLWMFVNEGEKLSFGNNGTVSIFINS